MNRKNFLKRSIAGLFGLMAGGAALKAANIKEKTTIDRSERIGFNHLPNKKKEKKMKTVYHAANSRGHANHGWLDSHHSFSFASYYHPDKMGFGALRVLNDDQVAPSMGFGTHPHDNMEIVSIPLSGDLKHKDSMGNVAVIKEGDVQVMSAGTGIRHSEYNKNNDQDVKFLQIWVFPNKRNVEPRYDQITLDKSKMENQLYQILSPNSDDDGAWVHQNAWFHLGNLKKGFQENYKVKDSNNGVYFFLLEGEATIAGQKMKKRDGLGVWDTNVVDIQVDADAKLLVMDVPMS